MSYYVCIGKTNYYATISKPVYAEFMDPTFIDYFDWMVGYTKTTQELETQFPFPAYYTDVNKRIWVIRDGPKPDNHQFLRKREIVWKNQTAYKPRTKEKYQDPNPKWSYCETPGLWKNLKKEGKL